MSTLYTIFCAILGETTFFSVKIASNETVDDLKDAIKMKREDRFASVNAAKLTLYHVDISGTKSEKTKQLKEMVDNLGQQEDLDPSCELTQIFPTAPPKQTIHIIVSDPKSDKELKLRRPKDPEFVKFVDAVKFFTEKLTTHTVADLGHRSNNANLHIGADVVSSPFTNRSSSPDDHQTPAFVSIYLKKLDGKRPASEAQLQQLVDTLGQTTCDAHFRAPEPEEQEMSSNELRTYIQHLSSHQVYLSTIRGCSSSFKDGHLTVLLVDLALTEADKAWRYDKNVAWDLPILLQGTLADVSDEHLYTFKPRNDFCLYNNIYGPLILGEIVSDKGESDRWRMLLEGIAVCRYQNMIRGDREAIALCLYLNNDYKMERYLVYQDAGSNTRDVHVLHDLTLDLTEVQPTFLLSKLLFNFRQKLILTIDQKSKAAAEKVREMEAEIIEIYSTSVSAARQPKSEARRSRAPANSLGPISEDAVLQASFKGIITLNRRDVATAIRRSDMQPVVLKRIRTNSSELRILRLLQSCARGSDHIIPLLEVVERGPGISTLVMPHYTPIIDLEAGRVEDLALQLICGIDWLHSQLISHSDIKENNLVFDERQKCLFIIDFGLAVKLTSREQKVRGARGTPGHVAPEVGITSSWENYLEEVFLDEDSIYSPILADLWAVGDVIKHFRKRFQSSTESIRKTVEKVAKELQVVDPMKRLSLNEAERRIAAECSMAATAPGPPAASRWTEEIHHTVPTVVLQA